MGTDLGQVIIAALVVISTVLLAVLQWRTDHSLERFKGDLSREQAKFNSELNKEQAQFQSQLEREVQRLAAHLDQRMQRLLRMRTLIRKVHAELSYVDYTEKNQSGGLPVDWATRSMTKNSVNIIELTALGLTIGDSALSEALDEIKEAIQTFDPQNIDQHISGITVGMLHAHFRIAQLLELEATQPNQQK